MLRPIVAKLSKYWRKYAKNTTPLYFFEQVNISKDIADIQYMRKKVSGALYGTSLSTPYLRKKHLNTLKLVSTIR